MSATLRTYALREAERVAMAEALNAMIQLADVRDRALSESEEGRRELHTEVMTAERQAEGLQEQLEEEKNELRSELTRREKFVEEMDAREKRILSVLDRAMAMLPPGAYQQIQGYRDVALAVEIPF